MKKHFLKLGSMLLTVVMLASVGCSDLKNDIQDVNSSVENVKGEVTDLKAALSALQAQLNADFATKNELSALQSTLEGKIGTEVNTLKAQIEALNAAVAGKVGQDDFDAVAGDVEVLKEGYAQTVEALTNLQNAIESAKAELEGAVDVNAGAIEDLTARLTAAEAAAKTMASDIESLKQASMLNVEAIQNLSMTCATLEANIEAAKAYTDKMAEEIYAKIGVVEQALTSVNNLLADETAARIEADEEIYAKIGVVEQALTAVNNLLADEAEKREAEDEEIYKQLNTAVEAISSVNALLEDLAAEDDAIYYEIETLRATVSSVITLHTDLAAEVADVEARLAAQEEAFAAHKEVIDAQVLELKNQLTSLEPVIENLTARTVELKNTIESLGAQVTEDITTLYAQTLELKNTLESLADQYNEDIDTLKAQSLELKNQLESLAPVIETLQAQSLELKNQLVSLEDVIASLQNEDVEIYKTLEAVTAMISGNYTLIQDLQNEDAEIYKQLQTLTEAISAVNTLTTEAQTKIDAMNEEILASIEDITEGLASQIQSIVVVPGQSLKTYQYTSGDEESPKMFTAKYEVTPIAAAAELENANVSFSTVVVRGGEEVTFDAEVIAVDEARGQVTVRGYITEDSEIYAAAEGYVALNVETEGTVATNVRSAYSEIEVNTVNTTVTPINTLLVLYNTVEEEVVTENILVEVPYTDKTVKSFFENIVPAFNTEDGIVTVADAAEYFGFPVEVKMTDAVLTYNIDNVTTGLDLTKDENKAPFYVVGKGLDATAQVTDVIVNGQVKDPASYVGSSVSLWAKADHKVNGVKATINPVIKSEVRITNIDATDGITFTSVAYDWEPAFGASYGEAGEAWTKELAVNGIDDITKLVSKSEANPTVFTAKRTYLDADGNEQTEEVKASVYAPSKKAVIIKGMNKALKFGKDETVAYHFTATSEFEKVNYPMSFDLTMGAMPSDKVIDLGNLTVAGITDATFLKVPVAPLAAVLAADGAAFGSEVALNTLPTAATTTEVEINGEESTNLAYYYFHLGTKTESNVTTETSQIFIHKTGIAYDDVVAIVATYNCFGITYTFKANVTVTKPEFSIVPNTTYVDANGVVTLGGKYAVGTTTSAKVDFALQAIKLNDYVKIQGVPAEVASQVALQYTLKTELTDEQKAAGYVLPTVNASTGIVDWSASKLQQVDYEIALVNKADAEIVYGEPVAVTLNIPTFVDMKAATPYSVDYKAGEVSTVYVAKSIKAVNAAKATEALSNATANVTDFASLNKLNKTATFAYNVFDQEYSIATKEGKPEVTFTNADGTEATLYDVTIDKNTGVITVGANNGHITGDITITVKVQMTQMYDNYTADTETVTITLKKK